MSDTMPTTPKFEPIPAYKTFADGYQTLLSELAGMKAGRAINFIIEKLLPYVQNYNLEYTQGNIANGQKAASYALSVTNYIASKYQDTSKSGTNTTADAKEAIEAYNQFKKFYNEVKNSQYGNPFGSMGKNVLSQLSNVLDGDTNTSQAEKLGDYWYNSWIVLTGKKGLGNNSEIMQQINGAQNQTQSEAAYLQSEAKIANEQYQKDAATLHDVAQNQINVEKASVTAMQSAGN